MYTNSMSSMPPEAGMPDITRLLLVDDDPLFLELCHWMLTRSGDGRYAVSTAASMSEAKQQCAVELFDCLLVDYRLPDGIGTQLIESLSEDMGFDSPATIVITAELEEVITVSADQAGADCCMTKENMSSQRLLSAIDAAVHRYRYTGRSTHSGHRRKVDLQPASAAIDVPLRIGQLSLSSDAQAYIEALSDGSHAAPKTQAVESVLQAVLDDIQTGLDEPAVLTPALHVTAACIDRQYEQAGDAGCRADMRVPVIGAIAAVAPTAALKGVAINTSLVDHCSLSKRKVSELQDVLETLLFVMVESSTEQGRLLLRLRHSEQSERLEVSIERHEPGLSLQSSMAGAAGDVLRTHKLHADTHTALAGLFIASMQRWDTFQKKLAKLAATVAEDWNGGDSARIVLSLDTRSVASSS